MRNLKQVTSFVFGKASYHVQGKNGEEIILTIDYKNNGFSIKNVSSVQDPNFALEVKGIATDLLSRKHAVNFANK